MAGRDRALVLVQDQARRRNPQHMDLSAGGVGHDRQVAGHGVIDLGVGIVAAPGDRAGHDARRDETRQVVDVAV
ncbi:hypothetical protein LTR94_024174, partial [Friedmanniomyces endolithicus]